MNIFKFLILALSLSILWACSATGPKTESSSSEHNQILQEYERNKPKTNIQDGEVFEQSDRPPSKQPTTHGAIGKPSVSENQKPFSPTLIRTYFGTNRDVKISGTKTKFGQKNSKVSYGHLDVSIPPKGRHTKGVIERPSIFKFEFRENSNKHIVIKNTQILDRDDFFSELNSNIRRTKRKNAFIFVHGFNVSFNEAAYRTAQMAYDLEFDGVPVFYSWPSNENTLKYFGDRKVAEKTKPKLEQFLTDFFEKTSADNVYLISHSMGGEVLTGAIVPLIKKHPEIKQKLKEIILTAPDIDAEVFKNEIAPVMTSTQKPITLYVSSGDTALKVSKMLNRSWRLGLSGEDVFIYDGIETVDMSTVDTSFLGHSYYGSKIPVLRDLSEIMNNSKRARERKLNEVSKENKGVFWRYVDEHFNSN